MDIKQETQLRKAVEKAKMRGGHCLSTEYINNRTRMLWKCHRNHKEWIATYANVVNHNQWCPECEQENKKNRNGLAIAKATAEQRNGECLSTEYINSYSKLEWKCSDPKHKPWMSTYNIVVRGSWCPECARKSVANGQIKSDGLQKAQQHALSKGGLCLSTTYLKQSEPLEWKCSNPQHASWKAVATRVFNGTWCPYCKADATAKRQFNHNGLSIAKTHAIAKGGQCLSDTYVNTTTLMLWQCANAQHKPWMTTFQRVVKNGHWCPECGKNNLSEKRTRLIFERYFGAGFPAVRAKWNVNVWTGMLLELDGYCKEFNLAFEHDGEHHERVVSYHGTTKIKKSDLIYQKFKDEQKRKNCAKQGITLISIPIAPKGKRNSFEPFLDNIIQACAAQGLSMSFNQQQLDLLRLDFYAIQ